MRWRVWGFLKIRFIGVLLAEESVRKTPTEVCRLNLNRHSKGRANFRSTLLDETGAPMKVQQELMRHAGIRTTMNVYGKDMDESKRAAHGKVVRLVLPSGGLMPLSARRSFCYRIEKKTQTKLVEPMGFESASCMETKELCGAPWPSKVLKGKGGNP